MNSRGKKMSTFRYGSSLGPARITGNAQEVCEEAEGENYTKVLHIILSLKKRLWGHTVSVYQVCLSLFTVVV